MPPPAGFNRFSLMLTNPTPDSIDSDVQLDPFAERAPSFLTVDDVPYHASSLRDIFSQSSPPQSGVLDTKWTTPNSRASLSESSSPGNAALARLSQRVTTALENDIELYKYREFYKITKCGIHQGIYMIIDIESLAMRVESSMPVPETAQLVEGLVAFFAKEEPEIPVVLRIDRRRALPLRSGPTPVKASTHSSELILDKHANTGGPFAPAVLDATGQPHMPSKSDLRCYLPGIGHFLTQATIMSQNEPQFDVGTVTTELHVLSSLMDRTLLVSVSPEISTVGFDENHHVVKDVTIFVEFAKAANAKCATAPSIRDDLPPPRQPRKSEDRASIASTITRSRPHTPTTSASDHVHTLEHVTRWSNGATPAQFIQREGFETHGITMSWDCGLVHGKHTFACGVIDFRIELQRHPGWDDATPIPPFSVVARVRLADKRAIPSTHPACPYIVRELRVHYTGISMTPISDPDHAPEPHDYLRKGIPRQASYIDGPRENYIDSNFGSRAHRNQVLMVLLTTGHELAYEKEKRTTVLRSKVAASRFGTVKRSVLAGPLRWVLRHVSSGWWHQ